MAYKLLKCILPIDIVNIIIDYHINYDLAELHMHKIYNNAKMIHINFYLYHSCTNGRLEQIKIVKNYSYAQTFIHCFRGYRYLTNLCKIIKYTGSIDNIIIKEDHARIYINIFVKHCYICMLNNKYKKNIGIRKFCSECDTSACKDHEFFKTVSDTDYYIKQRNKNNIDIKKLFI